LYDAGYSVAKDAGRARDLLQRACDGDFMPACAHIAGSLIRGPADRRDFPRGKALLERACEPKGIVWGAGSGCVELGVLYEGGEGVPKDARRAFELFEKGCTSNADCEKLADAYAEGRGVEKDAAKAEELYVRACAAGTLDACFKARSPQARSNAERLLQQLCNSGVAGDCARLAKLQGR
jgi:TPR repeat protein